MLHCSGLSAAALLPGSEVLHSPHRGAAVSREWSLTLAARSSAATLELEPPFAQYAAASFWLAAEGAPAASFLLLPLNEVVDEHYTVYFCKPGAGEKPARFCL